MTKPRVGVFRGGPTHVSEHSLKEGAAALAHLKNSFEVVDVFVDKNGVWHVRGYEIRPMDLDKHVDVVHNALFGDYGSDGSISQALDSLGVPYAGSGSLAQALAWNKVRAKETYRRRGLRTPDWMVFDTESHDIPEALDIFRSLPHPSVVKPVRGTLSHGVSYAGSFGELERGIRHATSYAPAVLVETYIPGKLVSCAVIDDFRGERRYVPPPVELAFDAGMKVLRHDERHGGTYRVAAPARISRDEMKEVTGMACAAHEALGARHFSQSDFIVSPRGVFIIETNLVPETSPGSPFNESLAAVGVSPAQALEHMLRSALR